MIACKNLTLKYVVFFLKKFSSRYTNYSSRYKTKYEQGMKSTSMKINIVKSGQVQLVPNIDKLMLIYTNDLWSQWCNHKKSGRCITLCIHSSASLWILQHFYLGKSHDFIRKSRTEPSVAVLLIHILDMHMLTTFYQAYNLSTSTKYLLMSTKWNV